MSKKVFVSGCYDMLHSGHVAFFKEASTHGDLYVGIGSDYDGIEITPDGMEDISTMPKLFDELRSRGYSEEDLEKIAGGNFFRVMEQVAQA